VKDTVKNIAVLGATGSIGSQTLDIIASHPERYRAVVLTAGSRADKLIEAAIAHRPRRVVIGRTELLPRVEAVLAPLGIECRAGDEALAECVEADDIDTVLTATVGYSGLQPTVRAIRAGKDIALANKETLVTAGHIIMPLARENRVSILPVDSEHSAIFQCLQGQKGNPIKKILLTASGGPFRGRKKEELKEVTVQQALNHPNWSMGKKITIDSATLVNKGLEVIEARWLFDVDFDKIDVVVQPQSLIHSMVQYVDGGIMAQLGTPDMKLPIQYAFYYPDRMTLNTQRVDFAKLGSIGFETPDGDTFRGFRLAYRAGRAGGSMPTVFNAANERAVSEFLNGNIRFLEIADIIEYAMERHEKVENPDLNEILKAEQEAYESVRERMQASGKG